MLGKPEKMNILFFFKGGGNIFFKRAVKMSRIKRSERDMTLSAMLDPGLNPVLEGVNATRDIIDKIRI